jgi:hypothetical protein
MACRKCGADVIGAGLCPSCISSVKSHTGQISRQKLAQAARDSGPVQVLDRHLVITYSVILAAFFPLSLLIYFHVPNLGALITMLLSINLVIYFLGIVTLTMLFMEIAVESPLFTLS